MSKPAVYSLADVITTLKYGPAKITHVLSNEGGGRITISDSGDLSSHTQTATGDVVINKLNQKAGTATLEVPVNSQADLSLRGWIKFVKTCKNSEFANTTLQLKDNMAKRTTTLLYCTPQKDPDENYDQASTNRQYTILFADKTVV